MKKLVLLLVLLLGIAGSVMAQQTPKKFVIGNSEIVPLQSKITGQAHELIIIYPDSYAKNPTKKFPVLYFLDAYWDVPQMVSAYGNLVYDKMTPEFIMVGLSYPDGTDYGQARVRDYTYTAIPQVPGSGKGEQFLDFIKKEVAPLIESTYHGDKNNRVLAGTSLGGSFTLGAALKDPEFFSGYIALSPAVVWDNNAVFAVEDEFAKQRKQLKGRMFISVGSLEPAEFRDPIVKFGKQLGSHRYKGLELQNYTMQGLAHGTVKGEGYIRGLKWFWQNKL